MTEHAPAAAALIVGGVALVLAAGAPAQVAGPASDERTPSAPGDGSGESGSAETDATLERAGRAAADELGVEFLGVTPVELEGRRLASVRVMEPGGNSNAAFLVQTLVVDPESGEVLGVFPGGNARSSDFPPGFGTPLTEPGNPPQGDAVDG